MDSSQKNRDWLHCIVEDEREVRDQRVQFTRDIIIEQYIGVVPDACAHESSDHHLSMKWS